MPFQLEPRETQKSGPAVGTTLRDPRRGQLSPKRQGLLAGEPVSELGGSVAGCIGPAGRQACFERFSGMFVQGGEGTDKKAVGESVNIADGKVKTTQSAEPKPKPVTLAQVRAVLAEKSRCGHTAQVRELLQKHGATKLSAINPTEFESLLSEAAAIGCGEKEDG